MAAAGSFPIEVVLKGLDLLSAPMQKAASAMDKLASAMDKLAARSDALKKIGGGLSSAGKTVAVAGLAVGAGVAVAANAYMDLEKAQVQAINAFSTNGGLSKYWAEINRQAIQAGDLYPGTSADFIKMAAALKRAGMSAEDLAGGGFKAAASLQVLMGDVPPDEAGRMFQVMSNALGLAGKDAGFFADQLQRVAYATPLTIQGAAEAFKYTGAGLKKMKIQGKSDADLVLATMGALKQTGLDDSQVGTAMGQFLEKMAMAQAKIVGGDSRGAAMKAAFEGMQSAGIDLQFFGGKGEFLGLANALGQVTKLGGLNDMQKSIAGKALFGQEGQRLLTGAGLEQLNTIIRKMRDQEDIQKRLARISGTLANQWESLKGTATNLLAAAVEPMAKDLAALAGKANALVTKMKAWADANPKLTRMLGLTAVGASALFIAGGGLLIVAGKLVTAWGGMITMLPKLSLALRGVALANPWILALVAGGALLAANWSKVEPIMLSVGESLGNIAGNIGDVLGKQAAFLGFAGQATDKFDAWGKAAWTLAKAIEIITTGVEAISAVGKIVGATGSAVTDPMARIWAGTDAAAKAGVNTKGSIWDKLMAANTAGGQAINQLSDKQTEDMLRPFDKIAARDPLGVQGKLDKFFDTNKAIGGAVAGALSQNVTFNITGGDPKAVADQVDQMIREKAMEYARILAGGQAVNERGKFGTPAPAGGW